MTAATETLEGLAPSPAPSAGHSIRANLVWVFAANAVYLASQWLVLAVVAKLGSPEMVGQLSLGFAMTAPIFLLSNLRLRTVQATDARGEYSPDEYLGARVVTTALALAAVALLCLVYPMPGTSVFVVMCVAFAKAFESGSDLFYGLFQQQDRTSRMTASIMARGICSVTTVALVCYFRRDAASAAAALCLSSVLLLLFCDIPLASNVLRAVRGRGLGMRFDRASLRKLTGSSFALGLSAMLMSLGVNMPRYFIERVLGTREVGIFSAVWYVATAGGYLVSALAEGAGPRLGRLFAAGHSVDLKQLLKVLLGVALLIGLGAALVNAVAGKTILGLIYTADYQSGKQLLVWLSIAATVANAASILSYGMIAMRKYRDHLIALLVMTVVTGLSCALLVPEYGLNGAALSLTLGYLVQAGWGLVAVTRAESVA